MSVIWCDVKGYEGKYKISNSGDIWSCIRNKELKTYKNEFGYIYIKLSKKGKSKHFRVHRLVALHFVPNPKNKKCVNHLDEDKKNNTSDNLEWCTHKENNNYGSHKEKVAASLAKSIKWRENKLVSISGINVKTREKRHYSSIIEAEQDGFSQGNISKCLSGLRKTHKGFQWYKEEF